MRKSVKSDKRVFVEGLAEEAERAAASRNMKELCDTTKKLAGKFKKAERPIRDNNRAVLTGVDKQLDIGQSTLGSCSTDQDHIIS